MVCYREAMLSMDGEAAGGLLVRQVRVTPCSHQPRFLSQKTFFVRSICRDARGSVWNIRPLSILTGGSKRKQKICLKSPLLDILIY